jgi:hypothetical protein
MRFPTQILFEDRKKCNLRNDSLLLVDETDLCIAMAWSKSFYSYKIMKCGLQYKVGLCIKTGGICWWSGPYASGILNDGAIFKDGMMTNLEPRE